MGALSHLEPSAVFRYFEEICSIPHGSGNTSGISGYCADFAEKRRLRYIRDKADNVIIYKKGTAGYENSEPVMIQGHLDMVCEKTADCPLDLEKDGLSLRTDGDFIFAEGTTLGGDDGIAIAYALALLDSDDIAHPPIEAVFTADEEIGMLGAAALDFSQLHSRTMINIDSEEEGYLLVSCAGGVRADCRFPVERESVRGLRARLSIGGLLGGHSGAEIDKGRANAGRLMGNALGLLSEKLPFSLISVNGGLKDNAIPPESAAELIVPPEKAAELEAFAKERQEALRLSCNADPDVTFTAEIIGEETARAMDEASRSRVIKALALFPEGVQQMSEDIPGLVRTSLNMGILRTSENAVDMCFSVRSSLAREKNELAARLEDITRRLGGSVTLTGDYPAWEYKKDSRLRDIMSETYERLYGRKPVIQAIHAGLECAVFAEAIEGLDCVSFGPDMSGIHTVKERLSISSAARMWEFLTEVLGKLV